MFQYWQKYFFGLNHTLYVFNGLTLENFLLYSLYPYPVADVVEDYFEVFGVGVVGVEELAAVLLLVAEGGFVALVPYYRAARLIDKDVPAIFHCCHNSISCKCCVVIKALTLIVIVVEAVLRHPFAAGCHYAVGHDAEAEFLF